MTCDCIGNPNPFNLRSVRTGHILHSDDDREYVLLGQDSNGNWAVIYKNFNSYDVGDVNISYFRKSQLAIFSGHVASDQRDTLKAVEGLPLNANGNTVSLDEYAALVKTATEAGFVHPTVEVTSKTVLRQYNRRTNTAKVTKDAPARARVVARTDEEIAELYKTVAEAVANPNKFWYESEKDKSFIRGFIRLRREAGIHGNLLISGPSGSGKTEGVIRLGEELGVPVHVMNCAVITTPEKWIGRRDILPDGTTGFSVSEHLKWVEATGGPDGYEPGIILYDEINRLHPDRTNVLYSLLDGRRALFVPDAGRYFHMHPDNIIVATANIGSAFSGTFGFDRALRERFNYTQERKFPPKAEEVKILTTATGISKEEAKTIVGIMELSRRDWERDELESPVSTRTGLAWATLVASGMSIVDAAEYTAVPLYKDDGGNTSDRVKFKLRISSKLGTVEPDEEGDA